MKFLNILPVTDETCTLVRHLELQPHRNHNVTDDDLADILPDCPNLETVIFTGVGDLTDRTLILLASNTTSLRTVDVSDCRQITDVGVTALELHANSLEVLRLNHVPLLTDPSISAIALSLSHLMELELCDSPLLTAVSIRNLWTYAKRLRRLRLARCPQLTDKAFPYASPPFSVVAERRLSGLKLLGRSFEPVQHSVDANRAPAERPLTWLEALPPLILPVTSVLEELRLLDLTNCYKITDDAIIGITTHAPRIQTFLLSGCMMLTDRTLESMTKLGRHLDVITLAHVDNITDRGISMLCGTCTRLRSVDISYCPLLTDFSILELGSLLELSRLSMANIPAITDNAILFLADHTPHLSELQMSHCSQISLEAIHILISRLTRLEQIGASGIPSLGSVGVGQFSEHAPPGHDDRLQGLYRVFEGNAIDELRFFLTEQERGQREADMKNTSFVPQGAYGYEW